jgi:hypothetical protein
MLGLQPLMLLMLPEYLYETVKKYYGVGRWPPAWPAWPAVAADFSDASVSVAPPPPPAAACA